MRRRAGDDIAIMPLQKRLGGKRQSASNASSDATAKAATKLYSL